MSTLADIQADVARYAQVIATVTGIDIEVADAGLVRIAGTGAYARGVGESIQGTGLVYRHVLRAKKLLFIEDPREHPICRACGNKDCCRETLSLCTPILDGEEVAGVIGLVCFTQAERERILAQRETFVEFLARMAEFLGNKLRERRESAGTRQFLEALLRVLDVDHRGVVVFGAQGGVSFASSRARRELGLGAEAARIDMKRTGDTIADCDEFVLTVHRKRHTVIGRLVDVDGRDPRFHTVLVFDTAVSLAERLAGEPDAALDALSAIKGESPAIQELKTTIRQVARSTSTVLISGESGTGKELAARAIHSAGPRRDKPFIAINCGAIPDTLLESELFGYTAGAFTGASQKGKIGKFELAQKGTLFLDEISSMPLYLQVKLLRVLQERQFTRLGSNRLIDLDIRVIAATNEDLTELIRQGRFREDLFYRLHVIPLETPPLRRRPEDIGLLADHFLGKYSALFGKKTVSPDAATLSALAAYTWPGNVREFENAIEYMVTMLGDNDTGLSHVLPPKLAPYAAKRPMAKAAGARKAPRPAGTDALPAPPHGAAVPIMPIRDLERLAIEAALDHFGRDTQGKREVARALDIGMATLYRKLKEYGLSK